MKLIQIVFGPTGGTGKVADIMAEEWNGKERALQEKKVYENRHY